MSHETYDNVFDDLLIRQESLLHQEDNKYKTISDKILAKRTSHLIPYHFVRNALVRDVDSHIRKHV